MNEEFNAESVKGFSFMREIYDWVEASISALLFVVLLFVFLGMIVGVHGPSMAPTLMDSERLLCSRMFTQPKYMDIVVVTKPDSKNNPLIKRVIATEGQVVDYKDGNVIVNGVILNEPYIAEQMFTQNQENSPRYPMTVPPGHVYLLGDNRNVSWDSRSADLGPVDVRYIFGRVIYRVMPYNRLGRPQ